MTDIKSPALLWIKGGLFVVLGLMSLAIVWMRSFDIWILVSACLAVWAFSRAYYFAFYVIEHYIDGNFRFAGLTSVVRYLVKQKGRPPQSPRS
jgi:hypothetical protein